MRIFLYSWLLLIISNNSCFGQDYIDYYNQANEAEKQFVDGNLMSARISFINLEKQFEELKPKDNFYLGMIHYFNSDTADGHHYLLKSTRAGFHTSGYVQDFQIKFPTLSISKLVTDQISDLQGDVLGMLDKKITDTLTYFMLKRIFYGTDSSLAIGKGKETHALFLRYLKENGMPNTFLYGNWVVTWLSFHASSNLEDTALYNSYSNFYLEEIKKGNADPYYYCQLIDLNRALYSSTVYGTLGIKSTEKISQQMVIENRKKIGLSIYFEGPGQLRPRYPHF